MRRRDEGQVVVAVVVLMGAFMVLLGLVFDGGQMLAAKRRAEGLADAAARSAASGIAEDVFRRTGQAVIDPAQAQAAASDYLVGTDGTLTDVRVSDDTVEVTVVVTQPLAILGAFGVDDVTATGVGRARLARSARPGR